MKLLMMTTDDRHGWPLTGKPPRSPHPPGETVQIESSFDGPLAFVGLRIGPDDRVKVIGPNGARSLGEGAMAKWRIDEIQIDGAVIDHAAVLRVAAQLAPAIDADNCSMRGSFGVGSRVAMQVTNVDDVPAYFYATWELEST